MSTGTGPEITVVLSAIDPRGVFEQVLRGWTQGQSLAPERYDIVLAGALDDEQAAVVSRYLRSADRHVAPDERDSGNQWAAAAAVARAPYLVFTEAHCVPAPGCLEELVRRFDETGADVLEMSSPGTTGTTLEWLDQRFVEGEVGERPARARAISPRAFAIRRDTYERLGAIGPDLGAFGDFHLAHRVAASDAVVAAAPRAAVLHHNVPTLQQPVFCVSDYVRGEIGWRCRTHEPETWDTFGVCIAAERRGNGDPRHLRAARRALELARARALRGSRVRRAVRAVRALSHLKRVEAERPERELRQAEANVAAFRTALADAGRDDAGLDTYRGYWRALARHRERVLLAEQPEAPLVAVGDAGVAVPSDRLFGFALPERSGARWLRMIRGVAGVRLPRSPEADGLRLALRPGPRSGPLLVVWNGRRVGEVASGAEVFSAPLSGRGPAMGAADDDMLVLVDLAHPLPKWARGPRAGRDVALLNVTVEGADGARGFEISPATVRE